MANDGANVNSGLWQVTWKADCAEAVISGKEQNDYRYILYFNGKTDFDRLETKYGMTAEEKWAEELKKRDEHRRQTASQELYSETGYWNYDDSFEKENNSELYEEYVNQSDENGYPVPEDYQRYKQEMLEIAEAAATESDFEVRCYLSAKGCPYAVVSRSLDNASGEKTELRLILNDRYEDRLKHEYVLEAYRFSEEGEELSDPAIVDFYLIDVETMEVTDEHTKRWH